MRSEPGGVTCNRSLTRDGPRGGGADGAPEEVSSELTKRRQQKPDSGTSWNLNGDVKSGGALRSALDPEVIGTLQPDPHPRLTLR